MRTKTVLVAGYRPRHGSNHDRDRLEPRARRPARLALEASPPTTPRQPDRRRVPLGAGRRLLEPATAGRSGVADGRRSRRRGRRLRVPRTAAGTVHDDRLAHGAHLDRRARHARRQPLRRAGQRRVRDHRVAAHRRWWAGPARPSLRRVDRRRALARRRWSGPPVRTRRRPVRRVLDGGAGAAHLARGHPPRLRAVPAARPLSNAAAGSEAVGETVGARS